MLRDEYNKYQDQIAQSSCKDNRKKLGYFKEIQFTSKEWMDINKLNEELEVRSFFYSTRFKILTIYPAFQSSHQNDGG